MVKYHPHISLWQQETPLQSPSAYKLSMDQPKAQERYTSQIRHLTRQHNLLHWLRHPAQEYLFPPSPQTIIKYKDINKHLTTAIIKANYYVGRPHMSNVHSSSIIKILELCLHLVNNTIKRRLTDRKIKIKTHKNIPSDGKEMVSGPRLRFPPHT